jgi:glutamyl-Q tRNA(Asp) synthetase
MRFAPSTTGYAHPGTLLSALLCWLDARSRGDRFIIRLENLDPERCRPEFEQAMLDDLAWLGLDWDEVVYQRDQVQHHEAALDQLAKRDLLYACSCSRADVKARCRPAADGGFAYDGACRERLLAPGAWRTTEHAVRVRLPDDEIEVIDENGEIYRQTPAHDMGDPVVRRRDGAIAYHLACVVDDARADITRLIRGRDLLPSAPVQILLHRMLGLPVPAYRHHFLLLEPQGDKLAKLHGSIDTRTLRKHYTPQHLCGQLAAWAGLIEGEHPCRPADLLTRFTWKHIRRDNLVVKIQSGLLKSNDSNQTSA